jgi:HEPN domain-containing protein
MRAKISKEMMLKEFSAAKDDLEDAKDSFKFKKYKWATIQG